MRLRTVSVPVVSGSDAKHMFRREFFKIFRSLDIIQESVRQQLTRTPAKCVPMLASVHIGWGQAGQSAKADRAKRSLCVHRCWACGEAMFQNVSERRQRLIVSQNV